MGDNKLFEDQIEIAAMKFSDAGIKEAFLISHNDADGYTALAILQDLLRRKRIPAQYYIFNREKPWSEFLKPLLASEHEHAAFIFSDLGGEISELNQLFRERPEMVFVLDHHFPINDGNPLSENMVFVNPILAGFDGLKEVAGATVTYLFAKVVDLRAIKTAWIATIGIAGDSLMHLDTLKSYNKLVFEEAVSEEQVIAKDGACLYGATHEKVKNALAWSILPYIPEIHSSPQIAASLLDSLNIPPNKNVEFLDQDEVERLTAAISVPIQGTYAILPKKQGVLRYAFEHALLLNVIGFKDKDLGVQALALPKATMVMRQSLTDHIMNLSKNLTTFCELPHVESENAIFVDVEGILPPSAWSDTASFASVNQIFDPRKMLFLSGVDGDRIKFSVRCSKEFIDTHDGDDVSSIIARICENFKATGGGHNLAGGLRMNPEDFTLLKKNIENYFRGDPA